MHSLKGESGDVITPQVLAHHKWRKISRMIWDPKSEDLYNQTISLVKDIYIEQDHKQKERENKIIQVS